MADSKRHARIAGAGRRSRHRRLWSPASASPRTPSGADSRRCAARIGLEDSQPGAGRRSSSRCPAAACSAAPIASSRRSFRTRSTAIRSPATNNACMTCHDWPANIEGRRAEGVGDALRRPRGQRGSIRSRARATSARSAMCRRPTPSRSSTTRSRTPRR